MDVNISDTTFEKLSGASDRYPESKEERRERSQSKGRNPNISSRSKLESSCNFNMLFSSGILKVCVPGTPLVV